MALSTVSGILTRIGMGKLGRLGLEPRQALRARAPGELIHIDVKKLGRIQGGAGKRVRDGLRQHYNRTFTDRDGKRRKTVGWEFVHIAIDDCTRLAYAEVLGDEKAATAIAFLRRAVAFFARHGVEVERLLTDNGSAYRSDRPRDRLPRARDPPPPHPPLPATDQRQSRALHPHPARRLGLRRDLPLKPERTAALDGWLWHYNHQRRHSALGRQAPARQPTSEQPARDLHLGRPMEREKRRGAPNPGAAPADAAKAA